MNRRLLSGQGGLQSRRSIDDVAKKYGLTKQAVQSYLSRFHRKVRERRPELAELI
jgi:predicted transcriptional regulator